MSDATAAYGYIFIVVDKRILYTEAKKIETATDFEVFGTSYEAWCISYDPVLNFITYSGPSE